MATTLSLPASATQPSFSWDGFYVGANIGFRASDAAWFAPPGAAPMTYDHSSIGLRGGLHGGYSWQFAPRWITGIEADLGFGDHETRQANFFPGSGGFFTPIFPGDFSAIRLNWDGSLRGRLGYLLTPSMMVFGTAGVAWQQIELNVQCILCGGLIGHGETTRSGWTVGGGVETALTDNWFVRTEYRYADFGKFDVTLDFGVAQVGVPIEVATHAATVGLTYRFGGNGAAPPAAWPDMPTTQWGGLYAGVTAGARFHEANWTTRQLGVFPINDTGFANYNGTGFRGGVLAGHDWQLAARWVAGVEADLALADKKTTLSGFLPGFSGSFTAILPGDVSSVRTTWDASARARFGYLLRPATLVYGTAGVAWIRAEANSTCGASTCGTTESITDAQTLTGWTVGSGLETKAGGRWRMRGEYRYADFGTMRANFAYFGIPDPAVVDIRVRTHTAQFALIYDLR